ncbi:MAG: DUF6305 family protein [Acholeplasmataceae bacterium]
MILVFSSCKKQPTIDPIDTSVFPNTFLSVFEGRELYVTSFGQSIDIEDLTRQLDALEITYHRNNYLEVNDISKDAVLILAIGCSIKGLQEAGTSVGAESERAQEIINQKEAKNLTVIAFHIGGVERRGNTSDGLINTIMSNTDFNIVYKQGDYDGFISKISSKQNIPMYSYEFPSQLLSTIKKLSIGDES